MTVERNDAYSRFELWRDGEVVGWMSFRRTGDVWALPHAQVSPAFEGRGLGHEVVLGGLAAIRAAGGQVLPQCPFIRRVMRENPDTVDLVAAERRAEFRL